MSVKSIGALAVVGLFSATAPFYAGGYFTHKALSDQLSMLQHAAQQEFVIENIRSNLGIWDSQFDYDVIFHLNGEEFAELRESLGTEKVTFTVNNAASHGFMSVSVDTTFTGQGKAFMDDVLQKINLTADNPDKPLMTIKSHANVGLTGSYELTNIVTMQGISVTSTNELGEQEQLKLTPFTFNGTLKGNQLVASTDIKTISMQTGDSLFSMNNLSFAGDAELDMQATNITSFFGQQSATMAFDSINFKSPDQEFEGAKDVKWYFATRFENARAFLDNNLTIAKAGNPAQPPTEVEDLTFNFVIELGEKALKDYYNAIEQLQQSPDNPQVAIQMAAKVLAEDINVKLTEGKAKTYFGLVDITANLDVAAVDPTQFQTNPAVLMQSVSYDAKGEVPKQLLMMVGQLPPEAIDNLIQNEMLIEEDQQIKFDMNGEKGHVNLNGKPLM